MYSLLIYRVLYFSIHRFDNGTFWPNLEESNCNFIGEGDGKGYNFNVPLNKIELGNAEYLAIFQEVLLPVATEVRHKQNTRVYEIFKQNTNSPIVLKSYIWYPAGKTKRFA